MKQYLIDFNELPWESQMTGHRYKISRQRNRQLRLVECTKDMEPRWCEKGHIGFVLDGKLEIRFENNVLVFNSGDGIFIPDGDEHKHMPRALTDVVRFILVEDV